MFTIEVEGKTHEIPDFVHVNDETFVFTEGEYKDVTFRYSDIQVDETDDDGAVISFTAEYTGIEKPEDQEKLNALAGMILFYMLEEAAKYMNSQKEEQEETDD